MDPPVPTLTFSLLGKRRRSAYRLLMNKGLIRIEFPSRRMRSSAWPPLTIRIPAHLFPAISPFTGVSCRGQRFLSTVMWDGRESMPGNTLENREVRRSTQRLVMHKVRQVQATTSWIIVQFELSTYTAQVLSHSAGKLNEDGGRGGPLPLSKQNFFLGINDPLGNNPRNIPFDPSVFRIYRNYGRPADPDTKPSQAEARESIRRETIFNSRAFLISDVAGLPVSSMMGTCTICHDSPNVGDHWSPS